MNKMLLLICFFLSSCAKGPLYKTENALQPDNGIVYIYRERVLRGSGASPSVFLNGVFVTFLKYGGYIKLELPAGEHTIEIGNKSKQNWIGWLVEPAIHKIVVSTAQNRYLKFSVDPGTSKTSISMMSGVAVPEGSGTAYGIIAEVDKSVAETELVKDKKLN